MSVAYLASAFFSSGEDPRENRVSVPSPPDADWWWDKQAKAMARRRRLGYSRILIPPVCKTSAGSGPHATGYGLLDHYDLGSKLQAGSLPTRFGNRERLQRLIAIAHANDTDVIADVVLHQMSGGRAGVYNYPGAPTAVHPNGVPMVGRFPKPPGCFRSTGPNQPIPPWRPEDDVPSPSDDFPFGDQCSYQKSIPPRYMIDGVKEWMDWKIKSLDLDGMRIDDTKGLWVSFVNEFRTSGEAKKLWGFNEYFDGDLDASVYGTIAWYSATQIKGSMSQLDFPFHWSSKDVCDYGHTMWRWMPGNSFADFFPFLSVLFVDSPDTDLSPGQQIIGNKLWAEARMLLMSQGLPMVYYRDESGDDGCYDLGRAGINNLVWCHEHLVGGNPVVRHIDADLIGIERLGHQVGKPGSLAFISRDPWEKREVYGPTAFGSNVHLHEYTGRAEAQGLPGDVWTDGNGWARTKVPSNEFGKGNSYTCWGPAGVKDAADAAARSTTQTFFGAADLDIAPAYNGKQTIGRVWCAKGTPLSLELKLTKPVGSTITLRISDAGGVLQELGVAEDGVSFPATGSGNTVLRDGWHSVGFESAGLPDSGIPFELPVTYTATKGLPHV